VGERIQTAGLFAKSVHPHVCNKLGSNSHKTEAC